MVSVNPAVAFSWIELLVLRSRSGPRSKLKSIGNALGAKLWDRSSLMSSESRAVSYVTTSDGRPSSAISLAFSSCVVWNVGRLLASTSLGTSLAAMSSSRSSMRMVSRKKSANCKTPSSTSPISGRWSEA